MISFAEFCEQIMGKHIIITADWIQVEMTASHVLIGNEIVDEDSETSVVIHDTDVIYVDEDEYNPSFEIRNNCDQIIFCVTVL